MHHIQLLLSIPISETHTYIQRDVTRFKKTVDDF